MYSISPNETTQNKFHLYTFFIHQIYLTNQTGKKLFCFVNISEMDEFHKLYKLPSNLSK